MNNTESMYSVDWMQTKCYITLSADHYLLSVIVSNVLNCLLTDLWIWQEMLKYIVKISHIIGGYTNEQPFFLYA